MTKNIESLSLFKNILRCRSAMQASLLELQRVSHPVVLVFYDIINLDRAFFLSDGLIGSILYVNAILIASVTLQVVR